MAVLGAGNMGSGIGQAFAQAGHPVRLYDLTEPLVEKARERIETTLKGAVERKKLSEEERTRVLSRLFFSTDLSAVASEARLIVEAVFEEEKIKRALFEQLASLVSDDTIVATNTSSLSVTRLQEPFPNPERFAGLHFFFPAAINRLVEVVGGARTAESTVSALETVSYRLKKIPIRTADRSGFAVNRFFVPYLNEATRLAEEEVANLATIEFAGRELFGTTLGPFELMNQTGVTIAYHSMSSLERAFGPAYAPTPLLKRQFESSATWPWKESSVEPDRVAAVRDRLQGLVFGIATRLVEEKVASPEATDRGAVVGLRWGKGPFGLMSDLGLPAALLAVETYAARFPGHFPVSPELHAKVRSGETRWPLRLVRVEREGPIAWVLLDRPEVLNAINSEVLEQLDHTFAALADVPELRVVVLAGSSPVFAAGADISEMVDKDLAGGRAFGFAGQGVCKRIEEFRSPVIALVEGYALGGGLELALACDFIVAAAGARLGLPEVKVGIHPGWGGASRLTRLVGRAHAKYVVFTGREDVTAEEAFALGFVTRVVPPDSARDEVERLASLIASRAPLAVQWVKGVVNRAVDSSMESALRLEGESAGHTFATQDRTEGMKAFLERRKPAFEGK
ncbi:MAG: enoyl-CoA hydratase-related protein [Thermoplasmata archaeon]|nr:enoyl-CoA hydratase-related protein [Thermoplasmata archaeon]